MRKIRTLTRFLAVLFIAASLPGCGHYMSTFDQLAYEQTTSLKVDVLNLLDSSGEAYTMHQQQADDVLTKMAKAIEYERHRPKNDITIKMWGKMLDSTHQGGIIGRYITSWKKGPKSPDLINEYKPLAAEGFDLIAELEAKKIKANDQSVTTFLNK